MGKENKHQQVLFLKQNFENSSSIFFFKFHGLSAHDMEELRSSVKKCGGMVKVAKNRLIKLALPVNISEDRVKKFFVGSTAVILNCGKGFPYTLCKELNTFMKVHPSFIMKGSIVEGRVFESLDYLLSIPPYEMAIVQLLQVLNVLKLSLICSLKSIIFRLSMVLREIEKRKRMEVKEKNGGEN